MQQSCTSPARLGVPCQAKLGFHVRVWNPKHRLGVSRCFGTVLTRQQARGLCWGSAAINGQLNSAGHFGLLALRSSFKACDSKYMLLMVHPVQLKSAEGLCIANSSATSFDSPHPEWVLHVTKLRDAVEQFDLAWRLEFRSAGAGSSKTQEHGMQCHRICRLSPDHADRPDR